MNRDELHTLLQEAKQRLSIPLLWRHFNFPGEVSENCCVKSPFRDDDNNPSFSIFEKGTRCKDHGTGESWDSYDFYQSATKLSSKTAYRPFIELAGLADRLERDPDQKKPEAPKPEAKPDPPEFDSWQDCVDAARFKIGELEKWRGLSRNYARRLVDNCDVGNHHGHWATPVRKKGKVVGIHYRIEDSWRYFPKGTTVAPYGISGDWKSVRQVHCGESQWDVLSLDDKLGITQSGEAILCTRGAQNAKLLSKIPNTVKEIFLWPQNDDAGKKWLADALEVLSDHHQAMVKIARVSEQFKDLNEWTLAGATANDLLEAIKNAELVSHPEPRQSNGDKPGKFAPGYSLAWYAKHPIDHEKTLLGDRYLCRGGGMFIVAPSGLGKSTLSIQLAILWCCGCVAFGIKPHKALRILIVQSEDDEGDCTEMAQMMNHLGLTEEQKEKVERNSELIRCNDLVGLKFIEALRERLQRAKDDGHPFDLVIINPYSVYLGDDVKDTAACAQFLNQWLNPILTEFTIAAILIHHTAKTNFQNTDKYKIWDWMYHGAGCAGITNWARAILAIKPETEDLKVFRFIAAKRGSRIGDEWEGAFDRFFAWSSMIGILRWEDATAQQIAQATAVSSKLKSIDLDKAIEQVPPVDAELKATVIKKIQAACGVGEKLARGALVELIIAGKVLEITILNPNRGRGFAGVVRSLAAA